MDGGSLNGEMLEEVDHFKYFGSQIGREGGVEVDVSFRVGEARKMMYEGVVVPTALYGA